MTKKIEDLMHDRLRQLIKIDISDHLIGDASLTSLGIDSLDFFELIVELEDMHGVVIPIDKLDANITLNQLVGVAKYK